MTRILMSCLLFIGIISSSVIIVFADNDIPSLLKNWFHQKTETMMGEISEEIKSEKNKQTVRLEKELIAIINKAEEDLISFTNKEKETKLEQLRNYADKIIDEFEVDHEAEMEELVNGFEEILTKAKNDLDQFANERFTKNNNDE